MKGSFPLPLRLFIKHCTRPFKTRAGFTLVELLIVIGIVAVISAVVVLLINPAQLFMQARDGNRVSDLATINQSIIYTQADASNLLFGDPFTIYVSVPDDTAASPAGTDCLSKGFSTSTLPPGWKYHCAAATHFRNVDGTGWIPIDLRKFSAGSAIGVLPVDPVNTGPDGRYYAYVTDGAGKWVLAARVESDKYFKKIASSDDGTDPVRVEFPAGQSNLWAAASGLQGYWKFDDESGNAARDSSGHNSNGSLIGGPTWTTGQVGGALQFDGVDDYVTVPDSPGLSSTGAVSIVAWVKAPDAALHGLVDKHRDQSYDLHIGTTGRFRFMVNGDFLDSFTPPNNTWQFVAGVWNPHAIPSPSLEAYLDGSVNSSKPHTVGPMTDTPGLLYIGRLAYNLSPGDCPPQNCYYFNGLLDDVRVYNRRLIDWEISAMYKAMK